MKKHFNMDYINGKLRNGDWFMIAHNWERELLHLSLQDIWIIFVGLKILFYKRFVVAQKDLIHI